jgi:hypothetical protein
MNKRKAVDQRIGTKLSDLKNLNVHEIRAHVIVTINQFEYWCSHILLKYFQPREDREYDFIKVLLNGTVVGFGTKIKLLRSFSIIDSVEFSQLMQLANIRNGFAHSLHSESIEVDHIESGETVDRIHHSLEILNNKGELELKDMKEWFEIFMDKSDYFLHWLPEIYQELQETGEIRKVTKKENHRTKFR